MRTWFRRCSTLVGLALAAVALSATAVSAQQNAAAGFLGGAAFSTLTGTDASVSPKSSTGFAGGFFVNFPVAKSLRLEPEILYVNKGSGFEDEDFTLNLNYIEIPVLLRYQFTEDGGPFAYVGPYVGFNVKCNTTVDTLAVPCKDFGVEAKTDFGGTVGIGYRKDAWGFDIRYDFGFTDVITDEKGKNSALMIMLRVAVN